MSLSEPIRGESQKDWGLWVVTSVIALAFLFT